MGPSMEGKARAKVAEQQSPALPGCRFRVCDRPDHRTPPECCAWILDASARTDKAARMAQLRPVAEDVCLSGENTVDVATNDASSLPKARVWIQCVAWRPGGYQLAAGGDDGFLWLFDLLRCDSGGSAQLALACILRLEAKAVLSIAWASDAGESSARLAVGCAGKVAHILDVEAGTRLMRLQHRDAVKSVAWHPNGTALATGCGDKFARVFAVDTGAEVCAFGHKDAVRAVAWHPDGTRLATACADCVARVFDVATGAKLLQLQHTSVVASVAWRPDGAKLATACSDRSARIFDAQSGGNEERRFRHGDHVTSVAWDSSGRKLATSCADKCARVFDAETGDEEQRVRMANPVSGIAWRPTSLVSALA